MSNPDSFIEEVTEEVRRDRLFALFRKYGWIGALVVLGTVGGAGWTEWTSAREEARAQAFGDAVLDALDLGAPEERVAALEAVATDGSQTAILKLLLASDPVADRATTLAALEALAADASQPPSYRDLAALRRVVVAGAEMPLSERRALLDGIAAPGRPYRAMALEQMAYLLVEDGKTDEAIAALTALLSDQEATSGIRTRAQEMIVALGGEVAPAAEAPVAAGDDAG
ncbi:tetratricopeptide repeat protein [Rhodobacter sp. HX-7-19]|uniref:Tetratricopeptide repeat protein n=1 Tax=Paragemmobacter kunshanensis TaxID=2583234 RepID=A0A6M1TLR6_9RHOB|nr:tetratricopeptide repeat protein [Rhodobacter kunshanensis]